MKSRYRFKILLVLLVVFSSVFITACEKTRTVDLTISNYDRYIQVTSYSTGGSGDGHLFFQYDCGVRIKRTSDSSTFENVVIKYSFKLNYDGQTIAGQEFTDNLGSFTKDHTNTFRLPVNRSSTAFLPMPTTSVQVLEISGKGKLMPDGEYLQYVGAILLLVFAFALLIYFPIRAQDFTNKFNQITNGMSYSEVINILGEPRNTSSAEDITTCIWKKAILRGYSKNYVLTFKDGKVVLDITHSNWS